MELLIVLALLVLGYTTGSIIERRHYQDIERREKALLHQAVIPGGIPGGRVTYLGMANGNVVVSVDYFKRFAAGLRSLVGGNVSAYQTLLDRARREAMLRMKESFPEADEFLEVRMETATLGSQGGRGTISIEVFAYGTAVKRVA